MHMATLSARTQSLVNAPLQIRARREAIEKSKRDRWPNTTIRVRFTDRTQLERTFPSTDKIRSVYAFVRSSLRDDVKPIKFVLCMHPINARTCLRGEHSSRHHVQINPRQDESLRSLILKFVI
ncbi:hypothetical protein HWV62_44655 [Athelia sp. TMB]|nr:hypothetical protein HWV62_35001 [Athelia sp. TMB]KAF7978846.1 hypothetical protein HWV62_44655 [Athelia sp. TMB]